MKVIHTKNELFSLIEGYKKEGKCVGFVPTMGALHNGHLSLVKACKNSCDIAVASVFVNPTQFNDPEDLKRYPRTPEKDGVGQVVSRLFDIVQPHKAFFGMKDFQQVAIIKNMVNQLKYDIEIIPCPIVREESGLALSSRNALLDEEHKKNAPHIYATLKKARNLAAEMSVADLKKWITEEINNNPYLETEYVEIVDDTTLKVIENWNEKGTKVVCVAVYAGKIRLIDNIIL